MDPVWEGMMSGVKCRAAIRPENASASWRVVSEEDFSATHAGANPPETPSPRPQDPVAKPAATPSAAPAQRESAAVATSDKACAATGTAAFTATPGQAAVKPRSADAALPRTPRGQPAAKTPASKGSDAPAVKTLSQNARGNVARSSDSEPTHGARAGLKPPTSAAKPATPAPPAKAVSPLEKGNSMKHPSLDSIFSANRPLPKTLDKAPRRPRAEEILSQPPLGSTLSLTKVDEQLSRLMDAWPALSERVRGSIMAILDGATRNHRDAEDATENDDQDSAPRSTKSQAHAAGWRRFLGLADARSS
jgi:hypothetical protein